MRFWWPGNFYNDLGLNLYNLSTFQNTDFTDLFLSNTMLPTHPHHFFLFLWSRNNNFQLKLCCDVFI